MTKPLGQKQIPTLLGIVILAISLIVGVVLLPQGLGVFAPRAAPETTPKDVKVSNLRENGFTVSFVTDSATSSFVKYGEDPASLKSQASDDRSQLSGNIGQSTTHHITVRELDPDKTYYYIIGTAGTPKFDNNGTPFSIKTYKRLGNPPTAKTVYGTVTTAAGAPAAGALVYLSAPNTGLISTITKDSGSWAIPLSTARTTDGSQYVTINKSDVLALTVQGTSPAETASLSVTFDQAQPVAAIALANSGSQPAERANTNTNQVPNTAANTNTNAMVGDYPTTATPYVTPIVSPTVTLNPDAQGSGSQYGGAAVQVPATASVVNINTTSPVTVETTQPTITGNAAPNTTVTVVVHSETEITSQVLTDAQGNFVLDLAQYARDKNLEPGVHTVTITYTDPTTGQPKTMTKEFTVAPTTGATSGLGGSSSTLLALASTSPQPFGTGNPFTISPSPTASVKASPTAPPLTQMPATSSALPKSGSVGTTFALIALGLGLFVAGVWGSHVAKQSSESA